MKIMIDTNVFLDILLDRDKLADTSSEVLTLCENGVVKGMVSASCITDIFYIVRKNLHSTEAAYGAVGNILRIAEVCNVSAVEVSEAFERRAKDFEDCLLAVCAANCGCDCIVTRNTKDFANLGISLKTPEEIIEEYR